MKGILKNDKLSLPFRLEMAKRKHREYLFKETLSLLILLYAVHLDQGTKRISDYADMTAREFNRELVVRTMMTEGQIRSRVEGKKQKTLEHEKNLLEALKASQK